jgi:hypothetical protein
MRVWLDSPTTHQFTGLRKIFLKTVALHLINRRRLNWSSPLNAWPVGGAATPASDSTDLSQEAVLISSAKNQFAATLNGLKVADAMQKILMNLLG